MPVGNGAVVVLVSSSFLVLYTFYLGMCIAEVTYPLTGRGISYYNRHSSAYFCIIHFPQRNGVHLVGKYLPILKYFNDPIPIIVSSPTSGNMGIKKIILPI